jgi:hypothetical protein
LIVKPLAVAVRDRGGFLQGGVGCDHFSGDQVFSDAEMFKRALRLSAPQLVGGYFNDAEAVSLFSRTSHVNSPGFSLATLGDPPDCIQQARRETTYNLIGVLNFPEGTLLWIDTAEMSATLSGRRRSNASAKAPDRFENEKFRAASAIYA